MPCTTMMYHLNRCDHDSIVVGNRIISVYFLALQSKYVAGCAHKFKACGVSLGRG